MKAIRDGLGDEIELMADVNQAWDVKTAIETCRRLEDYDLFWIEEPIPVRRTPEYDPDKTCGQIALATKIPIASGENHIDLAECRSLVEHGGIQYMQFDAIKKRRRYGIFKGCVVLSRSRRTYGPASRPAFSRPACRRCSQWPDPRGL